MNAGRLIQFLPALLLLDTALAQDLVFPQFVSGELNGVRNTARIILVNNDPGDRYGSIVFRDSAGQEVTNWPPHFFALAPHGTLDVSFEATGPLQTGTMEIEEWYPLSTASPFRASLIYDILGSRVSVPPSPVARSHHVYVSVTEAENTGIALYNPDPAATVTARLTLLDFIGINRASKEVTLGPRRQLVRLINEPEFFEEFLADWHGDYWPFQTGFRGALLVEVLGDQGLSVLALIQDTQTGALVSLPPGT